MSLMPSCFVYAGKTWNIIFSILESTSTAKRQNHIRKWVKIRKFAQWLQTLHCKMANNYLCKDNLILKAINFTLLTAKRFQKRFTKTFCSGKESTHTFLITPSHKGKLTSCWWNNHSNWPNIWKTYQDQFYTKNNTMQQANKLLK